MSTDTINLTVAFRNVVNATKNDSIICSLRAEKLNEVLRELLDKEEFKFRHKKHEEENMFEEPLESRHLNPEGSTEHVSNTTVSGGQ